MNNFQQNFPGVRKPLTDFGAVKTDLQTQLRVYVVDLSSARSFAAGTQLELNFPGNSFYIDKAPDVGNAYALFQDDTAQAPLPRLYVEPGFIARTPWTRLTIENDAQAGKVLRILYGVDVDFVPGTSAGVQITGTVNVNPMPHPFASSFSSSAALVAGTAQTVFLPAANTGGAYLWALDMYGFFADAIVAKRSGVVAHTSAPANVTTGNSIGLTKASTGSIGAGNVSFDFELINAVYLPAGLGLYFISEGNEGGGHRRVLYTLL